MACLSLDTLLCPASGLDLVLISEDELLVQFGSRSRPSELFRDNDLTGVIGILVRELRSRSVSLHMLLSLVHPDHQAEARNFVESLMAQGVISDVACDPVRQYLRYTLTGDSELGNRRVTMIGAGPIAARVARNLLLVGVGDLRLVDTRRVDEAWQAAVPLGTPHASDIGLPASLLLAQRLREVGHEGVQCMDWADGLAVGSAVDWAHLVILALEGPNLQLAHAVNRACVRSQRPWLQVVVDGNLGLIGPQFCSPDTACFNDYQTLLHAAAPGGAMAQRYRRHLLAHPKTSFHVGLPAFADVVSGHASIAAGQFLMSGRSPLTGRVMTVDFDGMRIDVEDVLKLPRCPVCATQRPCYRPPFPEGMEPA